VSVPAQRFSLVLASGSPRRLALLSQIGVDPDVIIPADLDETPQRGESPRSLAIRLSAEKARTAAQIARGRADIQLPLVLAADTVVSIGRRILPKCEIRDEAEDCLRLLSGRAHRVHTCIALVAASGAKRSRLVETRVRFKRLSREELSSYLDSGEWRGKAGGYAIQGIASAFVVRLIGSYTGVVGLPLAETASYLAAEGFPVASGWLSMEAR
jgi:septum formation protein